MNRYLFSFASGMIALISISLAEEPVCKKCQIIREYNAEHPSKDQYYEDYLKEKGSDDKHKIEKADEKKD